MLNGLDLFSGIGGITLALQDWVRPSAYCENDKYAQAVLLSRMADGAITAAPIWDDVKTLKGKQFKGKIDIIYGGFPCQDISFAGLRKGLEGERSGLFFEIMRLVDEIRPPFIFLENVPGIFHNGLEQVLGEITQRGYDSRWCVLSAAEVGANHKRNRWWLLAHTYNSRQHAKPIDAEVESAPESLAHTGRKYKRYVCPGENTGNAEIKNIENKNPGPEVAHTANIGAGGAALAHTQSKRCKRLCSPIRVSQKRNPAGSPGWWKTEPTICRVVDGLPARVDRIKCLGNAVVPLQAKTAFKMLMGIET